jgi:glc operon protein GlcG
MQSKASSAQSFIAAVFALLMLSPTAHADLITSRANLTTDGAKTIASAAIDYAHAHSAPGAAIAVVDAGGMLIYLERLDGTFQNAANISIGKARTAVLFGKPTRVFEDTINKGRYTMLALPEVAPFTPLMGGVPIEVNGQIVGAIGVSGASSAAQDDEIATAAVAQFIKAQSAESEKVTLVPSKQVTQGFRHDASLISNAQFRVNASHRDGPGEAEVHLRDTDIFYVLQGSAELVTGGEVVAPHNTASSEIRGTEIRGGDSHHLAQGDVMTIPRGVPHWFKQVRAPFTYYVVKSTTP